MPTETAPITPPLDIPENIQHSWGAYTPYFSTAEYKAPPKHCRITQVNIIQRHGARFPTSGSTERILSALKKIQSSPSFKDQRLEFLRNYTYDLGSDNLVPFGAAQSFDSGQMDYVRYKDLVNSSVPFVRASGSTRVVDSSTNWTTGFAHASGGTITPSLDLILPESLNDTLDDSMCPNAGSSDNQTNIWQAIYATSIAARLNDAAPGANLTDADASNLISLCAFDTVANERPSPFCNLFDQTDFDGFEYLSDLDKFYGTGYGQDLGPVQGVGYINELIARLMESPVRDNTQTNRTLDSDPSTFPLNRTMYADFSHDNEMIAIYSALGLFRQKSNLDPTQPNPQRTWITSQLTPFSARLVTERLDCSGEVSVRMLVNDALQTLEFCGADSDGVCTLAAFVTSQGYARSDGGGDFERCFT
ncbi:phosphoglycerate mutase-like protein [Fomitiporia mediterranea MF3/22]|uniref:phosphoglycerate mutase-like protein n=1 Tax=Fomitiporia mediterranea (strain MF3/22) TaxID=694068 RepID=UPI0004407ED3|nr:phosphoglycerate mutase-like protein [Fomitiporia mediterranea MF3/22]EJD01736.1 phosphoglycerate mutase-like protein [Fomitiporia mediterranea MF3/22]